MSNTLNERRFYVGEGVRRGCARDSPVAFSHRTIPPQPVSTGTRQYNLTGGNTTAPSPDAGTRQHTPDRSLQHRTRQCTPQAAANRCTLTRPNLAERTHPIGNTLTSRDGPPLELTRGETP
jgi:hypothetical protein